jgi:ATP-binding cassette subfamily B protein
MTSAKPKSMKRTLIRLAKYIAGNKLRLASVLFFVLVSSGAGVAGTYLIKPLLNDCIVPLIGKTPTAADLAPFVKTMLLLIVIYAIGVLASFLYSRLMVKVSNGVLNAVRRDLFNKMQDLPIRYFDTHSHGELMSRYTSDVDTLREAITQVSRRLYPRR